MVFLVVAVLLLVLLGMVVVLGLWGSHGHLPALVRGQFEPEPKRLRRDASLTGGVVSPYEVQVTVDLERPVAEVSPRYLSLAIDLSQVVGGKWWDPRAASVEWGSGTVHASVFDFQRPRLDRLAEALSPAYLRIGGSEADKVYYELQAEPGAQPILPAGYHSMLTRLQWDAIQAFAGRTGLEVVCTLNAGPAARNRAGRWHGKNASELLAYTAQQGYPVAVWELGNELNIFYTVHGLAGQVPVAQYAEDLRAARALIVQYTPGARLAGQGSAFWPVLGEPLGLFFGYLPRYLRQAGDVVDIITWHYYPQQSRRGPAASRRACPSRLLDPHNLDEAAHWAGKIDEWRDRYAPGKPIWLGETGNAQFGGEPGLSDVYLSGLWWLDQLGLLARQGQQVVIRQTLAGLDYGLLDGERLEPRPDYWHSLLWKRLMGTQVHAARANGEGADRLRTYAHAAVGGKPGAVTVMAINLDHEREASVSLPDLVGRASEVYALTTPDVLGRVVYLNGAELKLDERGALPEVRGAWQEGEGVPAVLVRPLSAVFLQFPAG